MTQIWKGETRTWVIVCDETDCATTSEKFPHLPDPDLFIERGWFMAELFGDVCPACLAKGVKPTATPYPYGPEISFQRPEPADDDEHDEDHPVDPDAARDRAIADQMGAL